MSKPKPLQRLDYEVYKEIDEVKQELQISFAKASKVFYNRLKYGDISITAEKYSKPKTISGKSGQAIPDVLVFFVSLFIIGILAYTFINSHNQLSTTLQNDSSSTATEKQIYANTYGQSGQATNNGFIIGIGLFYAIVIILASFVEIDPSYLVIALILFILILGALWSMKDLFHTTTTSDATYAVVRSQTPEMTSILDNLVWVLAGAGLLFFGISFMKNRNTGVPGS